MSKHEPTTVDDLVQQFLDSGLIAPVREGDARLLIRMWAAEITADLVDTAGSEVRTALATRRQRMLDPLVPPKESKRPPRKERRR